MASTTLDGTTVLVTGAAGGLGKAIATAYLEAGANVAICDVNEERLAETRAELEPTGRFLAVKTDITDEAAVQALVDEAVGKFGRLDILVNNAGIMDRFDAVGELEKDTWDRVLNINLTGSYLAARAAVRAFQKQAQEPEAKAGGLVIQIGSNASYMGLVSGVAYTVSKHGVQALVKHTAGYYGDEGIYAVGLMLGGMPFTNISEAMRRGDFNQAAYAKTQGISGFGEQHIIQVADVAKYAVFLSDRSVARSANGSCVTFNANFPKA